VQQNTVSPIVVSPIVVLGGGEDSGVIEDGDTMECTFATAVATACLNTVYESEHVLQKSKTSSAPSRTGLPSHISGACSLPLAKPTAVQNLQTGDEAFKFQNI
jgi:hypothetical protein